jgi:hypothetical protein
MPSRISGSVYLCVAALRAPGGVDPDLGLALPQRPALTACGGQVALSISLFGWIELLCPNYLSAVIEDDKVALGAGDGKGAWATRRLTTGRGCLPPHDIMCVPGVYGGVPGGDVQEQPRQAVAVAVHIAPGAPPLYQAETPQPR